MKGAVSPERPGSSHASLGPLPPLATDLAPDWEVGAAGRALVPGPLGSVLGRGTETLILSTQTGAPRNRHAMGALFLPGPGLHPACLPHTST